jgi:hypothetical protein
VRSRICDRPGASISITLPASWEGDHETPGQPDPLRLGGGFELKTPFGSFYPPNISPDPNDGIGRWKVVDLANALLAGVSPEGQHYHPALPYTSYQHLTVGDVRDLMAFLRTLPPVQGRPPPTASPFPFQSAAPSDSGSSSISITPGSIPIRRKAPAGILAAIS